MERDRYWTELLTVLTEDENLRLRKNDFDQLKRTDIREFLMQLKIFEERCEERLNKLKEHGKG